MMIMVKKKIELMARMIKRLIVKIMMATATTATTDGKGDDDDDYGDDGGGGGGDDDDDDDDDGREHDYGIDDDVIELIYHDIVYQLYDNVVVVLSPGCESPASSEFTSAVSRLD
eukprot:746884-Hanusia_phi.AAC.1